MQESPLQFVALLQSAEPPLPSLYIQLAAHINVGIYNILFLLPTLQMKKLVGVLNEQLHPVLLHFLQAPIQLAVLS